MPADRGRRQPAKTLILIVLLASLSACTKWSEPQGLQSSIGAGQQPDRVRLMLRDRQGVLESPRMVGDSIFGRTNNLLFARGYESGPCSGGASDCVAVAIPARDVAWVEVREPDGKKTFSWVFLSASIVALGTCLAVC